MLLADPPALGTEEQPPSGPPVAPPVPPDGAAAADGAVSAADAAVVNGADGAGAAVPAVLAVPASGRACVHCGTPLHPAQAWCLHCGAPEPSALSPRSPRGPLRVLAALAVVLAVGAAAAGAAVLTRHKASPRRPALALVRPGVPGAAAVSPTGALPSAPSVGAPGKAGPLGSKKALFPPPSAAKPPKIPSATPTPEAGGGAGASEAEAGGLGEIGGGSSQEKGSEPNGSSKEKGGEPNGAANEGASKEGPKGSKEGSKESGSEPNGASKEGSKEAGSLKPTPLTLDTNAASTYNPYNYPSSSFGDPALAIDGELSTAWTAAVRPESFPKMAVGLVIDLRAPTAVGSVELVVPSPSRGMTVEIFGAASAKHPPTTITAKGWKLLSKSHVLKKTKTLLRLRMAGKRFGYVAVWITKASAASRGTVAAPGLVSIDEVSLLPPTPGR
jgi:hypothetical protein